LRRFLRQRELAFFEKQLIPVSCLNTLVLRAGREIRWRSLVYR
jgi:hypothetical protein